MSEFECECTRYGDVLALDDDFGTERLALVNLHEWRVSAARDALGATCVAVAPRHAHGDLDA